MCENIAASESDAPSESKSHLPYNAVDIHKPSANLTHRWLINGNWKLILPHKTNTNATEPELYNLTKDPHETQNLAKTNPHEAKRLAKQLNELLPES